jgi:hypothetical protein
VKAIEAGDRTVIGSLLPARAGEYAYFKYYLMRLNRRL